VGPANGDPDTMTEVMAYPAPTCGGLTNRLYVAVKLAGEGDINDIEQCASPAARHDDFSLVLLVGYAHVAGRRRPSPPGTSRNRLSLWAEPLHRRLPRAVDRAIAAQHCRYRSKTRSLRGAAEQISTSPSQGRSNGAWTYVVVPATTPVTHTWQTPLRQEKRVGTSQASASSRILR
jgi:hypothetical protein